MLIRPGIELASMSDVGCVRENNEDSLLYWEAERDDDFARKGRLAVIADGMGGYEGGQEASRLAVETVVSAYADDPGADSQQALVGGLQKANDRIRAYAETHPELYGMGTTCTALALRGHRLTFAHVGDSRLYLVRGASLTRLTRDHSYVARLVESGLITPEDAESHPQRNLLTAALGAGADLMPQTPDAPVEISPGDVLVLCTDGLWGQVHNQELQDIVSSRTPAAACSELVALARERGGPDNITLQIIRIPPGA